MVMSFSRYGFGGLAVSACLALATPVWAHSGTQEVQDDPFASVEIETIAVADGISMLVGRGGNIGVFSGPDGVFVIDTQFAALSDKVKAAIAEISDEPLRYVVNTHWHFDHTGGNAQIAEDSATIVAHANARTRLKYGQRIAFFDRDVPPAEAGALPGITYTTEMTLHLNGKTVTLLHVPSAHTDGDTIVHFPEDDVIHAGDTLFNGFYPFIDLESGGHLDGMLDALDLVLALAGPDTKIIPGHGPLADRNAVEKNRDMLALVRERTAAALDEGKSLEEILAMDLMADYNADWAQFISGEQIVTFAYRSLKETAAMEEDAVEMTDEETE